MQAPERNPRACFVGPFLRVGTEGAEKKYLLAVRSLKLFIAVHYVIHGCYLPKQESGEPQELIYTTRIGKYLSQQMNSTLELCCIPVPPPPLEH